MKTQTFIDSSRAFIEECVAIMNSKGAEYAHSEDKFANFKRIAAKYNVPVEEVCGIYLVKHLDSIDNFIKRRCAGESVADIEAKLSEPISGRIGDAINYLLILKGIIDEQRENEKIEANNAK